MGFGPKIFLFLPGKWRAEHPKLRRKKMIEERFISCFVFSKF